MKSLGQITCGILTAAGSAAAAAQPLPVVCPSDAPGLFCDALSASIAQAAGDTQTVLTTEPQADGPFIQFVLLKNNEHFLEGRLAWRTASGATGEGPALELTSMDAAINSQMLSTYASQLVDVSELPDMIPHSK